MSLSSIRSRVEAAMPGPWTAPNTGHLIDSSAGTVLAMVDKADGLMTPADAAFIAHARQDIPALLRVAEAAAEMFATAYASWPGPESEPPPDARWFLDARELRAALVELEALP